MYGFNHFISVERNKMSVGGRTLENTRIEIKREIESKRKEKKRKGSRTRSSSVPPQAFATVKKLKGILMEFFLQGSSLQTPSRERVRRA